MVVTSSYVTDDKMPIVIVTHEIDEEDQSHLWQFHCGNGDYAMSKMQLVRFDTIVSIEPTVKDLVDLPPGMMATRNSSGVWTFLVV
jgi:hypothetical protein